MKTRWSLLVVALLVRCSGTPSGSLSVDTPIGFPMTVVGQSVEGSSNVRNGTARTVTLLEATIRGAHQ